MTGWIIFLVLLIAFGIGMFFLYRKGNEMQKKQEEQKSQLEMNARPCTMLVIDKKKMPLKDAGLPQIFLSQTPKRAQRAKVPVVKAKIGPQITTLIADENVYDLIPVKAEIKAMVSGIYITSINNFRKAPVAAPEKKTITEKLRGKVSQAPAEQPKKSKKKK